ncbi:probable G-protein coupled receptor 148 [Myripristis murdjan]|uniref:probable G-protein coupled receptor 148 n=1 Tax=Myripristis murdjan TaxID=586833 RepID=UPI0011762E05|nr:probable G-protein coupled receptor 148 [Myripristis murdjan]
MGIDEDPFRSLLCAIGNWYNSSGQTERDFPLSKESNTSDPLWRQAELFINDWYVFLSLHQIRLLQLCPILGFMAVSLVIPVLLAKILTRPQMCQETRYLLLANVLLSDLLFLTMYTLCTCVNAAGVLMSEWACATMLFLLGALYSSGILSTKAIVLDTSLAVLAPLRYFALWPVSRTKKVILGIWAVSVIFPAGSAGVFVWYHTTWPCSLQLCSAPLLLVLTVSLSAPLQMSLLLAVTIVLLILLLVFSGYVILYWRTRTVGIQRGSRSSRARGTFLMHYFHLLLSFCPLLVLAIELLLYCHQGVQDLRANLWVSLVLCNLLLVLPKALAPYLYGFRYRELRSVLLSFYGLKRPSAVTPMI